MKRKLLKSLLCLTICGSVITGLLSEPFLQVWATASASKETLDAIDQAEEEKERLEGELKEKEENKGQL